MSDAVQEFPKLTTQAGTVTESAGVLGETGFWSQ